MKMVSSPRKHKAAFIFGDKHELQRKGLVLDVGFLRHLLVWRGYWIDGENVMSKETGGHVMTPLPTLTVCEHCKKELPKSKCKYVKVQRYSDGRFNMVDILVCADRCASYYHSRQNIKSLQRRMHTIQRRQAW